MRRRSRSSKVDPDGDVAGRRRGRRKVRRAHLWCRPEGQQQPRHQRVPHDGVEAADLQGGGRGGVSSGRPSGLPQPDELEVSTANVDAIARTQPAPHSDQSDDRGRAVDVPDLPAPRLPEHQQQRRGRCRWRGRTSCARAPPGSADAATTSPDRRAITECWTAKSSSSATSTATARAVVVRAGPSTVRGTTTSARKAIVHTMIARNPNQPAADRTRWAGRRDMPPCLRGAPPPKQPWNYLTCAGRSRRTRRRPGSVT